MEKYIGILYCIDGVYGEVKHGKIVFESEIDSTFNKYIAPYKHHNLPDVKFNVSIRNQDNETIFEKYDIEGLPSYLNVDMGTYFRMAQLREMKGNNGSIIIDNFIDSDTSLEEIVEKVSKKIIESLRRRGSQI